MPRWLSTLLGFADRLTRRADDRCHDIVGPLVSCHLDDALSATYDLDFGCVGRQSTGQFLGRTRIAHGRDFWAEPNTLSVHSGYVATRRQGRHLKTFRVQGYDL